MRKKKWTIERIAEDDLLRAIESLPTHFHLPFRENVILTAAMIDVGLANILSKRLNGPEYEVVAFLGADEDGRAPCGSFGSRIQLARLLLVITDEDVVVLRALKKIRNYAAHRIKLDVTDPKIREPLSEICKQLTGPVLRLARLYAELFKGSPQIVSLFEKMPDWPKAKEALTKLTQHREVWEDMDARAAELLPKYEWIQKSDLRPLLLIALYAPSMIGREPVIAPLIVTVLFLLYQARLKTLLGGVTPVQQLILPRGSIKMWDSDLLPSESKLSSSEAV